MKILAVPTLLCPECLKVMDAKVVNLLESPTKFKITHPLVPKTYTCPSIGQESIIDLANFTKEI